MRFNRKRCSQRSRRAGFTLLELLLVMAILVVLASLSGFAILNLRSGSMQKAAFIQIKTLDGACTMYKLNVGTFPKSLDGLYSLPSGMTAAQWGGPYLKEAVGNDPWGRAYTYRPNDLGETVVITSAGPDGQPNTQDDVPQATGS